MEMTHDLARQFADDVSCGRRSLYQLQQILRQDEFDKITQYGFFSPKKTDLNDAFKPRPFSEQVEELLRETVQEIKSKSFDSTRSRLPTPKALKVQKAFESGVFNNMSESEIFSKLKQFLYPNV